MTEPTPVQLGKPVAPAEQTIDGIVPAPVGLEDSAAGAGLEITARSQWSYARRRFVRHRLAMGSLVVLVIVFGAGAVANVVAPYSFEGFYPTDLLLSPTLKGHHFFGTDELGRDYLSRVIYGIRTSLEVGVFVAVVSSILGLAVGAVAGYFGGWLDNILMRITDLVLTLPLIAILLTVAALKGNGSQWR